MKSKITLIVVLVAIIGILGVSLDYEIVQRHKAEDEVKAWAQMFIALGNKFYQGLDRGDVEAVKRRLAGDVAANAVIYEQKYGHDPADRFTPTLAEAKALGERLHPASK